MMIIQALKRATGFGRWIWCGLWFYTLATACIFANAPVGGVVENLSINGQVNPEQADFVLRGRFKGGAAEAQEPKLIYALNAKATIQVEPKAIAQTIELKAKVFQGKLKEMLLVLRGDGEITQVAGPDLRDWSVRHDGGKRFLVIRPVDPGTNAVKTELTVTVTTRQSYKELPFGFAPLSLAPENAALFDGTLEVRHVDTLELSVTNLSGLAPVQATLILPKASVPPSENRPLHFRFSGSEYVLAIELRERDPEARKVRFVNLSLVGNLSDQRAVFTLTGEATVKHPEGGSLVVLAGEAALTSYPENAEVLYDQGRYWLRFRRAGTYPIELKFDAKVTAQEGWNGLSFEVAPSSLRPITLQGLTADTQFLFSNAAKPERHGADFVSYLASAGPVRLQWKQAKPEEAGKLFYAAETVSQVAVGPGLLRQAFQFDFKVMQGELNQLSFDLTGAGEVTRVRGEDILAWRIEGKPRRLIVQLNQARKDRYSVLIQTQTPLGVFPLQVQPLRLVPAQVIRFGGYVQIVNDGAVRLEVTEARGLSQVSPELFPKSKELAELGGAPPTQTFAYRFSGGDFSLNIQADNILPELSVSQMLVYHLGETETAIEAELELDIREAPVREFYLRVPADFAVARLTAPQLSDSFTNPDAQAGWSRLRLVFTSPLSGRQIVQLRLEKNLTPTNGAWVLPVLQPQNVKTVRGYVGVAAETGFRLTAANLTGLTEIASAFFPKKVAGLQLAYRLREEAWQATMNVERLSLSVQTDVVHLLTVSEGVAYGSTVINYLISGTPVSTLRVTAPPEYSNLEFAGRDVRNWKKVETNYEVYLQAPVFGTYTLLATFDRQFGAQSNVLALGGVRPLDVQSEQGSVLVVSQYPFEVTPAEVSSGLLQLDPAEIPAEQRLLFDAPILAAYQYTARPFTLRLALNSLAQGDTVHQVVDRALLKTRVSREGEVVTEARYFVKSKGLSHLRLQVPASAQLWEARVNGTKVVPVADGAATLIPMPLRVGGNPLVTVDLQLAAKSPDKRRVNLAMAALAAPVLLTEWNLTPDEGYHLQFESGTVAPTQPRLDRSGFAWLGRLARGADDRERRWSGVLAGGLLLLGALALRWATRPGTLRGNLNHWVGSVVGLLACAGSVYYWVDLITFAAANPLADSPSVNLTVPIQATGQGLAVQVTNTRVGAWGMAYAWPGLVGLLLWLYLLARPLAIGRRAGWALGWTLLAWAALRSPNGAPVFFGLVIAFICWHVLLPAIRCQWSLPRKVKAAAAPATGAATALILAGLLGGSIVASAQPAVGDGLAKTPAEGSRPTVTIEPVLNDDLGKSTVQSLVQQAHIRDSFVVLEARLKWKTEVGQRLTFLRAPAVLTRIDYPKAVLQLNESRAGGQSGYRFTAQQAGEFEIVFTYELVLRRESGALSFTLTTPSALVSRLQLEVERAEVEFFSPQAVSIETQRAKRRDVELTRAELVLAPGPQSTIGWRPRGRDTALEKAVFYAEWSHLFVPTAGVVEGVHDVQLRPAQGQLSEVSFQVPPGLTVTDVQAESDARADFIANWRFDPDQHQLRVQFRSPQARPFGLRLHSQLTTNPLPYEQTNAVLSVEQAAGQVGLVGVATSPEVQLDTVKEQGLSSINLEDFPAALVAETARQIQGLTLRRAYRYAESSARLAVAASAVQPDVRVETQQTLSLGEDRIVLAAQAQVQITRAGIFKLSFALPPDFEAESLSGAALSHWTELRAGAERIITLHLRGKTEGMQSFNLSLAGPGLGTRKQWEAPRLVWREANKQAGQLVIVPELGLRLHVQTRLAVTQLDPQKAGIQQKGVPAFRLLNADWRLSFDLETVEPWIEVASLQDVTVREGQVSVTTFLDYQIENAGVKSLLVEVPTAAEGVHFEGDVMADAVRGTNVTARLADWEVKLQRRVIGNYSLRVTYQVAATNRPTELRIVGVKARNANLQRGYVAIRAGGRLQLAFPQVPAALQRTEWSSIPAPLRRGHDLAESKDTFSTLETDFELPLSLSRHDVAKVLPARVERVELVSVVAASGQMLTQGQLWLQPGDKRLLHLRLPAGGQFWYAFVNGESAWPWREADQILLLLDKNPAPNKPTTVEFFYTCPAGSQVSGRARHQLLGPSFDLPLENITWRIYVPQDWQVKDWESTLQLRSEEALAPPTTVTVDSYLQTEAAQQKETSKEAETMLLMGNDFLQKGVPQQARRAYQAAWKLSESDAAFNEDARVQLHNLKMQQALLGLNQRRQTTFERGEQRGTQAVRSPFARWAPGQSPAYTQQQVQQVLEQNPSEDNAALLRLAERMIRQQDASVGKPEAIRAALPTRGKELTFTGSLQVDTWADLRVQLDAKAGTGGRTSRRLLMLGGVFVGLALLAALTRRPADVAGRGL